MTLQEQANRNVNAFLVFRIFFNSRFYYPVLTVLFLDLGLNLEQYSLLNTAWAASIFFLEVPSGALADIWGRRKLVVIAGFLMVLEMLVFSFAPNKNIEILFALFLLNRALSGAAEASASGADEALVYDSLKAAGRESEWPSVLSKLGRWQSLSFFFVMIVGAAIYDPTSVNAVGKWLHLDWHFVASDLVRMPLYLTLVFSLVALGASLALTDPPRDTRKKITLSAASLEVLNAAKWILKSPAAMFVLFASLCNDAFIRLFMTMTSQYYRVLNIPETLFGVIGSLCALLGFVAPFLAQRLIKLGSPRAAFSVLSTYTLIGLFLLPVSTSRWSILLVFALTLGMGVVGFLSSYYLNEMASPSQRATILSFRGLTGNLAYGGLGLLFAGLLKSNAHQIALSTQNEIFLSSLAYLPWIFLFMVLMAYLVRSFKLRIQS